MLSRGNGDWFTWLLKEGQLHKSVHPKSEFEAHGVKLPKRRLASFLHH